MLGHNLERRCETHRQAEKKCGGFFDVAVSLTLVRVCIDLHRAKFLRQLITRYHVDINQEADE